MTGGPCRNAPTCRHHWISLVGKEMVSFGQRGGVGGIHMLEKDALVANSK
jgi:hypothetical protein